MKADTRTVTTAGDVVNAMRRWYPDRWIEAGELRAHDYRAPDVGIPASIQSISNALRHAFNAGKVDRRLVARGVHEWRLK